MRNLISKLNKIQDIIKTSFSNLFQFDDNSKNYPNKPKASDIQIVAMSILMEMLSIHSERHLFFCLAECDAAYAASLPLLCNFNRRRKNLTLLIDEVTRYLSDEMISSDSVFLIDSTPIEVCRYVRFPSLRIMRDNEEFRPTVSKNFIDKRYYAGYKLHSVVSDKGVIVNYQITQAHVHDVSMLKELVGVLPSSSEVIGDKGYISEGIQLSLFDSKQIKVYTASRSNQKPTPFPTTNRRKKLRMRIETCFSQLKDQFNLKVNYAQSQQGFKTRIVSKIAAFTFSQYLNFLDHKPLSRVKNVALF